MSVSIKTPDENPSNVESILSDTIGLPGYKINPPGSRIEELLIELNELIKGGGGGGSDAYAADLSLTIDSSTYVITAVLKNQNGESIGTPQTIDLPMESVVVSGSYNSQTKKVVLTLQNGSTVEFSVADLIDGLQAEITSANKLDADLVDDSTSTNKFVTSGEKSTWNGKQNALSSAQLDAVNSGIDSTKVEQIETNKNNISSIQKQANWNSNYGVKNICPYNSGTTSTGEGTVWNNLPIDIAAGTYSVSFSTDSTNSALVLLAADGATEVLRKTYSATTVNDTFTISTAAKYIRLYIGASKTVSNFMIHSFGDDTYQPYAMSNVDLTALSAEDRAALVELVDGGAKNLFYMAAPSGGTNVIRTVSNGTILLNGAATYTPTTILLGNIFLEANRKYIITGCPQGGTDSSYRVDIRDTTGEITYAKDYGEGAEFTPNTSEIYQMLIRLVAGYQLNNVMFKPMICTPDNYAISPEFVPYRPSYQKLCKQTETNKNNISSEQAKTTGMSEGGSNYITVGGIRVYVSSTAPTGARTRDLWIGG